MTNTNKPMIFIIGEEDEAMTAAQLIAALEKLPPETPVYRADFEYGMEPVVHVEFQAAAEPQHPHGIVWRVEIS